MTEIMPLMKMLNRVFPWDPTQYHTGARIYGVTAVLDLLSAQALVAGGYGVVRDPTDEESDAYAVDIARVVGAVLAPWLTGENDVPPQGARLVSALAMIVSALVRADLHFKISEEYPEVITELEAIARRIDRRRIPAAGT